MKPANSLAAFPCGLSVGLSSAVCWCSSRGLRTKLYSIKAIEQYLEETK